MANESIRKKFDSGTLEKAKDLIEKSHAITLITHYKPDGDGISACAALEGVLLHLAPDGIRKTIETIYPSESDYAIKRHPQELSINTHRQTPDLLIALDTANYERLYYPNAFLNIPLINIDHHISNTLDATYNFVDQTSSSTCEILYLLLREWFPTLITSYVANCLLYGILTDSQVFHTSSTGASTLRVAADLIEKGADLFDLKDEILSNKDPNIIKLWGHVMNNINFSKYERAAWTYVSQKELKDFGLTLSATVGFNNFLAEIVGIDVTVLFYETDIGNTKISFRSKTTDVNKLAQKFGGGGHKNAAGALIEKPLKEAMQEVVPTLEEI